jgi:hypothetical protein
MPIVIGTHCDENEIIEHVEHEEKEDDDDEQEISPIDLAILYNYTANINTNDFNIISIPELKINYKDFIKLAFNNQEVFDIFMMDRLFKHLKISLVNTFLTEYERKENTNRNIMDPSLKINLTKEFYFDSLSNIIKKYETLNLKEFNVSVGSTTNANRRSITAKINIKLYSNILNIGIIIPFSFKIYHFSNREPKIIYYIRVRDDHHHYHDHNDHHDHHDHHC